MKVIASDNGRAVSLPPREAARQLESEIAAVREEISALVAELDRRRHEAFDVKLQVRRHGLELALSGVALVAAASGYVWLRSRRSRRRAGWRGQLERLREAVIPPSKTGRRAEAPRVVTGILTAAANAGAAVVIKRGLERALRGRLSRARGMTLIRSPFRALARRGTDRAGFNSEPVAAPINDTQ